ncbi:MAG: TrkA family potassium uptake protein [Melioribacteraceae bacterium]|nr:TrkA family potassium uptake protein [Melioribacteraceae bacterium]MCF8356125.1 TrkA family potassium uptake protein [Melioribacteraceae bacterium]MCF8395907.1 TrkA family potassium uptake protein [Melioribacteraceae bacterium]MCF8420986.1 TrkA family potassium uptake protein [Melioribacteraceae bacterium]
MKNIAVIGLSSFGYYLCKELSLQGYNIMAVEIKEDLVNQVKPFVRKAVIGDAKDKGFLMKLGITDFDTVIISVGSKIDVSILITLYMKELKIKEIIAKAVNEDHSKILEKIGATRIIFPERDLAQRMAHTIASPNFLEYIPLTEGFSLIEVAPAKEWCGKPLKDLRLRNKYQIQIAMIREIIPERVIIPDGEFVLKDSDILYIIGSDENINKLNVDIS